MTKSLQITIILTVLAVIALSAVAFVLGRDTVASMAVIAVVVFIGINWLVNG